jgi:SulP family sulfate permease
MTLASQSWLKNSKRNLQRYFQGKFRSDLTAGLTVAMVVIPQAMAYVAILGINPVYGLFTAIVPTIIAALLGSFPFLVIGPTNPTAIVAASVLMLYADRENYLQFVFALAIVAGVFSIIFGLLKLGSLMRYISNSVLVGFLSGVGVLIISFQLGNLFGLQLAREATLWGLIIQIFENLSEINFITLVVSLITMTIILVIRSINRKLPASLIAIIVASLLVYITGWNATAGVKLVGEAGLPLNFALSFHLPNFDLRDLPSLLIPGAAVSLFSMMETLSIAKAMSQMTGKEIEPSRQMIGQGIASFIGGFFQCMPSSGSPSRTVINIVNGAKTRYAAVISGLSVFIFLLLFSTLLGYIPIAALAAVVIVSAAGLFNTKLIQFTWQSQLSSRIVMLITFISTMVLPLEYAIYLGIISTILIYLGESSRVNLSYMIQNVNGQYLELPIEGIEERNPDIAVVNIEGDLYFAAIDDLQKQIERILQTDVKVLILRFRRTHLLASTGIMALDHLIKMAREKGVQVLFCGVQEETYELLKSAGLTSIIGDSKIFTAKDILFDSTHSAINAAKTILGDQPLSGVGEPPHDPESEN